MCQASYCGHSKPTQYISQAIVIILDLPCVSQAIVFIIGLPCVSHAIVFIIGPPYVSVKLLCSF